jgi:UDP-2,3-diacylglucosamine pyrophosphatase LpxH
MVETLTHQSARTLYVQQVDTFIVSDVHLGTDLSRPDALLATLKQYAFRRLILLGDILDDLNFSRLPRSHWDLLAYIRTLCAMERDVEVVWVAGNHDHLLSKVTRNFLGLPVHKRYQWTYEGKSFLALHGHQFDTFIAQHPLITEAACLFYRTLQRLDAKQHRLSRFLKRTSKTWLRMSEQVARGAAAYAERRGVSSIFCGHTHQPLTRAFGRIAYHNTGCWTELPATFITVGDRGVELHECP